MKTIITFAIALVFHFSSVASELFIRVNANGDYFISAYNQTHYNGNNIFKFSDLPAGVTSIQVINRLTNSLLYSGSISLKHNERIVAQIDQSGKLTIIQKIQIQEVNWYTTTTNNDVYPNNPYPGNSNHVNTSVFQKFLSSFKSESMDSNKLTMAKSFASSNQLTAEQIADISKEFSFDSNRLEFAKHAYANCIDKANYFLLKDTFSFTSNYTNLLKHIEGK